MELMEASVSRWGVQVYGPSSDQQIRSGKNVDAILFRIGLRCEPRSQLYSLPFSILSLYADSVSRVGPTELHFGNETGIVRTDQSWRIRRTEIGGNLYSS